MSSPDAETEPVRYIEIGGIKQFDVFGEPASIGHQWKRWIRNFELFALGKGVTNDQQKKSLLLHSAGMDVQDLFATLTVDKDASYADTKTALDSYFIPQVNEIYERHLFRNMHQTELETVDQFVTRLRQKAIDCGYDTSQQEQQILDQVVHKINVNPVNFAASCWKKEQNSKYYLRL